MEKDIEKAAEVNVSDQREDAENIAESHGTPFEWDQQHLGLRKDQEKGDPTSQNILGRVQSRQSNKSNVLQRAISRVSTQIVDPGPPPDGGLTAWTQCLMAHLVSFSTWGFVNSFGTFQTYYTGVLKEPPSTISWIGSIQIWAFFFIGAFSGRALDAGLFRITFAFGMLLTLLGVFMTSLSSEFWQFFLSQGICTGLGMGIMFVPAMGLCTTYFEKRRALAVALVTIGSSSGGVVFPIIARQLLPKIGFGWTVRVQGFLMMFNLTLVLIFMKPRLPPRKSGALLDWRAFGEAPYSCFVFGCCLTLAGFYFTAYYIASFGKDTLGLEYTDALNMLLIFNGCGIPARALTGYIADYYGVLNTMIPLNIGTMVVTYCWLAVSSSRGMIGYASVLGFISAAYQSLFPSVVASLTKDPTRTGSRLGMAFTISAFAGMCGPPLGGALLRVGKGYMPTQIWAGTTVLAGCVLVIVTKLLITGRNWGKKC